MTSETHKPLKIFCSYSRKDEEYLNVLRNWLRGLERQKVIEWWHDREIVPGWEWEEAIDKNLRSADINFFLVTPDFMVSDYVFEREINRAIERHERSEARVIPIIVRPSLCKGTPLSRLQALPKDAKPITRWPDSDEAWLNVAEGIQEAVEELLVEHQQRAVKAQYHEAVVEVWSDNKRTAAEVERLNVLANDLGLRSDPAGDVEYEVMGDTKEAILERQKQAAREQERKERLGELYVRARRSHQNQEWQAVVDIFAQIHSEDPAYQDPEDLLASAHEALETLRKEEEALRQYRMGVASAWADGKLDRREVEMISDLTNKLEVSRSNITAIEREVMGDTVQVVFQRQAREKEERQERLDGLYAQARRLDTDQEWQAVVDAFDKIRAEDPTYPDSEGLLQSAREALLNQRVAETYDQGLRHAYAKQWLRAASCFEEVLRLKPRYRDAERLLAEVRQQVGRGTKVFDHGSIDKGTRVRQTSPEEADLLLARNLRYNDE